MGNLLNKKCLIKFDEDSKQFYLSGYKYTDVKSYSIDIDDTMYIYNKVCDSNWPNGIYRSFRDYNHNLLTLFFTTSNNIHELAKTFLIPGNAEEFYLHHGEYASLDINTCEEKEYICVEDFRNDDLRTVYSGPGFELRRYYSGAAGYTDYIGLDNLADDNKIFLGECVEKYVDEEISCSYSAVLESKKMLYFRGSKKELPIVRIYLRHYSRYDKYKQCTRYYAEEFITNIETGFYMKRKYFQANIGLILSTVKIYTFTETLEDPSRKGKTLKVIVYKYRYGKNAEFKGIDRYVKYRDLSYADYKAFEIMKCSSDIYKVFESDKFYKCTLNNKAANFLKVERNEIDGIQEISYHSFAQPYYAQSDYISAIQQSTVVYQKYTQTHPQAICEFIAYSKRNLNILHGMDLNCTVSIVLSDVKNKTSEMEAMIKEYQQFLAVVFERVRSRGYCVVKMKTDLYIKSFDQLSAKSATVITMDIIVTPAYFQYKSFDLHYKDGLVTHEHESTGKKFVYTFRELNRNTTAQMEISDLGASEILFNEILIKLGLSRDQLRGFCVNSERSNK